MAVNSDRRRAFRIAVPGDLLLWRSSRRFSGDYKLADLSISGCAVRNGPPAALGRVFDASLRIGDAPPVQLQVRVVRRERDGRTGLSVEQVDPAVEDEIHDILVSQLECCGDRAGDVLVVHPRPEFAVNLVMMLERLGHRVRVTGTPLEAIWALEDCASSVHTAIVSRGLGHADGRDMMRFLARSYPRIRRVLLAGSEDDGAEDRGGAHEVLEGPLDLGGLRRVLPDPHGPHLDIDERAIA